MALPATIGQQRALAYAPKPFAIISFISSGYIVHHLIFQQPEKRQRLYHRLVLAMNLAIMARTFMCFYGNWAVPAGTSGYAGAVGNVQLCTATGFIALVTAQTICIYYGSLGLQSFMAMRKKLKKENYVWIEKWIHLTAWIIPCALSIVLLVTENINPNGAGCWAAKAPRGCESDPEIVCERGRDITWFANIFGMGQYLLYLVYPPLGVLAVFLHLKKIQKRVNSSSPSGMQLVRASAQKEVLHIAAVQISVYLFSFWCTNMLLLISGAYQFVTKSIPYNLNIFGNVIYSLQGFVIAFVYFALEKLGRRKLTVEYLQHERTSSNRSCQLTVSEIRQNAKTNSRRNLSVDDPEEPVTFHIFDGTPDEDSPWAMYFNQDDDEDDVSMEDELVER